MHKDVFGYPLQVGDLVLARYRSSGPMHRAIVMSFTKYQVRVLPLETLEFAKAQGETFPFDKYASPTRTSLVVHLDKMLSDTAWQPLHELSEILKP